MSTPTAVDLEVAIATALDIAAAVLPFTPAAELEPLAAAAALLATKIASAQESANAKTLTDAAVAGIETAVDAAVLAKFPPKVRPLR